MINKKYFKKLFQQESIVQGVNAMPYFINTSAYSGMTMKNILGYGYSMFIFDQKNDYMEGHYLKADFARIWRIIKNKLKYNSKYLERVKQEYEKRYFKHQVFFNIIDQLNFTKINDNELIILFKQMLAAQIDSIGTAHIIEPIGVEAEKELKDLLSREINDHANLNQYFIKLTAPVELSYVAREEKDRQAIGRRKYNQALPNKHLQKYYWLNYSYLGPRKFTLPKVEEKKISNRASAKVNKQKLIKKLKLSRQAQNLIAVINFATIWQDERKKNVLIAIGYADKIVNEISRRVNISKQLLYYLCATDIFRLKRLGDFKNIRSELKQRSSGAYYVLAGVNKERIFSGATTYKEIRKIKDEISQLAQTSNELHGSAACGGTAIGRVRVIKYLHEIGKIRDGDILVTSMTRPEFMPAIKKSAAIITDEGGITCHAAIISRELGLPAVIGTKIATKVLHDGMMIEVRANHGAIRILSK